MNTRFPLLFDSLASPYPPPVAPLYEKKQDFSALPPISSFAVYAHSVLAFTMHPSFPSPPPPFTVTWLHLMTGLTPAYRIKLISTKQGSVEGGWEGVEEEEAGVGGGGGRGKTTTGGQEKSTAGRRHNKERAAW